MIESTPKQTAKPKTYAIKIRAMGARNAVEGFFIADGVKIKPQDVCTVPVEVAQMFDGSDYVEQTKLEANCSLEWDGDKWVLLRE
jgi:hypothetical protein